VAAVVVPRPDPLADVPDACLPLLAASCASFLRRGARFSARSALSFLHQSTRGRPSSPARPIAARRIARADRPGASREVAHFPSAFTGRAVPSESGQLPDHPASTFFRSWHPRRRSARPCGFQRLASSFAFNFASRRRRPRGSFVNGFVVVHVPGSHRAVIAAWPGSLSSDPGDAHGFFVPFAVSLRFPGERVFRRLGPTCRFAFRPPRVSSSRDPPLTADHGLRAAASGLWPRKPAVPCDLPTPL